MIDPTVEQRSQLSEAGVGMSHTPVVGLHLEKKLKKRRMRS